MILSMLTANLFLRTTIWGGGPLGVFRRPASAGGKVRSCRPGDAANQKAAYENSQISSQSASHARDAGSHHHDVSPSNWGSNARGGRSDCEESSVSRGND